jgi:hypothetical protein
MNKLMALFFTILLSSLIYADGLDSYSQGAGSPGPAQKIDAIETFYNTSASGGSLEYAAKVYCTSTASSSDHTFFFIGRDGGTNSYGSDRQLIAIAMMAYTNQDNVKIVTNLE